MAHRYNVRMFLLWSCTSSIEDIMAVTLNLQLAGNWGFSPSSKKVLDGQLETLSESEANEWEGVLELGKFLLVVQICHIQVVHVRNSFLMKAWSTCAVKELLMRRRKSWRDLPNLREIYVFIPPLDSAVPPVPPTIFPVALHGVRRAWHRVDVAARGSGRGAEMKKCPWKPGGWWNLPKLAPGYGAKQTFGHIQQIYSWNIGTFVLYLVPEKMSFEYEEWAEWLDYVGFRWI